MSTTDAYSVGDCSPERVLCRVDEAICAVDDEWQVTFANEQAVSLLELTPDALLGHDIWVAVPGLDEQHVGEHLRQAMETQCSTEVESYSPETDRWFKLRLYPAADGITVCFYDITDEHSQQRAVERQRRLFESVFEETQDALVVADTDRRITEFNPAAEALFGYAASEVVGERTRLLYADPYDYQQQGDARFNEGAPEHGETYSVTYERADGTTFEGETLGTALKGADEETVGFLGSIRDVSSRVEYEREIKAHNDAIHALQDITTDGSRSVGAQISALLELGTEYLGLEIGILSAIDGDEYTVEHADAPTGTVESGERFDLDETFCERVVDTDALVAVTNAGASELATHPAYDIQGLESYIGVAVIVDGERYGTLNFSQPTPRPEPFTEGERTFVRVLAEWIGKELSRQRSRALATANRDRLRQIIDLLPQLVFAKDRDNEYILANQAIADAYGTTVEGVEGSTDADFVTSEAEAEQFRADDLAVIESGEPKQIPEEPLTKADGETVVLQTIKIPYDPVDRDTEAVLGVATDITERKRRERKLEETTQRLNLALEATRTGVWELDVETQDVVWADSMEPLFGIESGGFGGTFDAFAQYVHPEDLPAVERAIEHALETDGIMQVEYRIQRADDTQIWVEARAELIERANQNRRLVGIVTDITDRKQRDAEIELQSSAMEVAMDGIAILDGDEYVYMNEAHANIFGYEPAELVGSDWRRVYGEAEVDRIETDVFPVLVDSGGWRGETVGRTQDGAPVDQDIGLSLLDTGELICTNRDITEQKQREQELRRSREFIEKAQESAAIGGWEVDLQTDSLRWTDEVYRIHDLPTDAAVTPQDGIAFYHPDDRPTIEAAFERLTTDGEPYDLELRIVTAADRVRWVRAVGEPQFADGRVVSALGVFQDITDQKQLEASLRESNESLRTLTEIASDTDRPLEAKLSALLELGAERLDLPFGFVNRIEQGRQHVVSAVGDHPELQAGNSAPTAVSYCRKTITGDGILGITDATAEGWSDDPAYERFGLGCYVGGKIVIDGDPYGTLCFAADERRDHEFDATERSFVDLLVQWVSYELASDRFETKLQQINDTAQRLMNAPSKTEIAAITTESASTVLEMPIAGIWWSDEDTEALVPGRQTDAATAVVGPQPTFERGTALAWEAFVSDTVGVYDNLDGLPGRHDSTTDLRSEVIVPLGRHGVVIAASTEPQAFSKTDRNLLEVLSATVESALTRAERETTLRETQRKLAQSNEELEQFAYAASHDLQEPLRTVSSYLTLLERRYGEELDGDAIEFIEFAVDGADRMRDMIQALLAYSRVDTRGQAFEAVELTTVFDRVTRNLDVKITEEAATVSTPTAEQTVLGDINQLVQLFQNLLDNALKYNTGRPHVEVTATRDDETVRVDITDDGIGIDPEQTEAIFEVFQRLHTREEFDGTGIGLSICRKIVERHDGEISVESEPGEGTTVSVSLPVGGASDV